MPYPTETTVTPRQISSTKAITAVVIKVEIIIVKFKDSRSIFGI